MGSRSLLADYVLQTLKSLDDGIMYKKVFECLYSAIMSGILPPQSKLPSSRDLAKELKVSRNTVLNAYQLLYAQGYIQGYVGKGSWVNPNLPDNYLNVKPISSLKDDTDCLVDTLSNRANLFIRSTASRPMQWGAFSPGVPDVTEFPHKLLKKSQLKFGLNPKIESLMYNQGVGSNKLKQSLTNYLRVSRSIRCDPDQIIITEGTHQAVDFLSKIMCDLNDTVWIEDPCYWVTRKILNINGLNVQSLPVDKDGICVDINQKMPKLLFVTPSHHYPLGSHLSLERRRILISAAKCQKTWIIEDDYDSEFRFNDSPLPSLQGFEDETPVIYLGTFSKTIYPGLRIGYMVVPKCLASKFSMIYNELYRSGQLDMQLALSEFIDSGNYVAHIKKMRILYSKRRGILVNLIKKYLGDHFLHEYGQDAGLHIVLKLPNEIDDVEVCDLAYQMGINVRPLSLYYEEYTVQKGLLLGFACVPEKDMLRAFNTLLNCLKSLNIIPNNVQVFSA